MKNLLLVLLFSLLSMTGCMQKRHQLFTQHAKPYVVDHFDRTYPYRIRPYDRLMIRVFEYPELSTHTEEDKEGVQVASNGTVLLPLLGRVKVAGYSTEVLEERLHRLYSEYLEKRPAVKVEVLNQRVYVLGEVKNPGSVDMRSFGRLTPLQAISERGGLNDFAKRDRVLVIRGTRQNYKVAMLDLTDMSQMDKNNMQLAPEDIVYVAHNSSKDLNLPLNGLEPTFSLISAIFNTVALYQLVK